MLDGCGRDITYARISVTDLCNLGCAYCKPRPVPKLKHEDILSVDEIIALANDLVGAGFTKIRLTGGEPLVRKGILPIARGVCEACTDVRMTTNGVLLARYADDLRAAGITRINVSLDTVDAEIYREVTGGGELKAVLEGIAAARKAGMSVKINAVLQRGVNDDPLPLTEYAASVGAELRMIEMMPFASTLGYVGEKALNAEEWARALGMLPVSSDGGHSDGKVKKFSYRGAEIGVIAAVSSNFCAACNRIRITSTGMLLPCLHGSKAYPVRDKIGSKEFAEYLRSLLALKPLSHGIREGNYQQIDMGSIGG